MVETRNETRDHFYCGTALKNKGGCKRSSPGFSKVLGASHGRAWCGDRIIEERERERDRERDGQNRSMAHHPDLALWRGAGASSASFTAIDRRTLRPTQSSIHRCCCRKSFGHCVTVAGAKINKKNVREKSVIRAVIVAKLDRLWDYRTSA